MLSQTSGEKYDFNREKDGEGHLCCVLACSLAPSRSLRWKPDSRWLEGRSYNFRVDSSLRWQMCPAYEPARVLSHKPKKKQKNMCTRVLLQNRKCIQRYKWRCTASYWQGKACTSPEMHMNSKDAQHMDTQTHCEHTPYVLVIPLGWLDRFFPFQSSSHINPESALRCRGKKNKNFFLNFFHFKVLIVCSTLSSSDTNTHADTHEKPLNLLLEPKSKSISRTNHRSLSERWYPQRTHTSLWHIHFPKLLLASSPISSCTLPLSCSLTKASWLKLCFVHPLQRGFPPTYWGKWNGFTQVLYLPPRAGNPIWCPISRVRALLVVAP